MKNNPLPGVDQLPKVVTEHFRSKLLTSLDDAQLNALEEIEKPKDVNWHHGARGLYKDPVDMHKARVRYNSNYN